MKAIRRSGTVVALAGALALTALSTAPAARAASTGISVTNVVVNGGKPIVVGTTDAKEPSIDFRVTLPAGYSVDNTSRFTAEPFLYHGSTPAKGVAARDVLYTGSYTCYKVSSRVTDCKGFLWIPPSKLNSAADAGTWKVGFYGELISAGGSILAHEYKTASGSAPVRRWANLTANAGPEPVVKGKTLTVTGALTRADWATHAYAGYGGQAVSLQFRKATGSTYSTVKTVTAGSTGALKTTVTASVDGYWRWTFGGTPTTGTATATGDYVDVR
ncbi:hypothetical protein [Streptomyces sp. AM 2-1-1]|uniref:hypothetical protein n=1 Tax=unclassified Streptomyces TaxID=2593676 RepID=UPI0023BA0AD0|nr:hypothetical protein [Streptomyces sp. AM 2-1-1]WEH41260.1 hypothetical protein PZB77_18115 [Streptomyces sp. AM 2-1-1]